MEIKGRVEKIQKNPLETYAEKNASLVDMSGLDWIPHAGPIMKIGLGVRTVPRPMCLKKLFQTMFCLFLNELFFAKPCNQAHQTQYAQPKLNALAR